VVIEDDDMAVDEYWKLLGWLWKNGLRNFKQLL